MSKVHSNNQIKLLIVDDEIPVLNALTRVFKSSPFVVKTTDNGHSALNMLYSFKPDVIISDMRMPNMSGEEFLAQVNRFNENIICIILSGYSDVDSMQKVINNADIYHYMSKPWDDNKLKELVIKAAEEYYFKHNNSLRGLLPKENNLLLSQTEGHKEKFLSNISHELRTPMHGILSFSNIGIKGSEHLTREKILEYFTHIKTSADRLMNLVDNFLEFTHLKLGQEEMHFSTFSIKSVTENCVVKQQALLDKLKINIIFSKDNIEGIADFDDSHITYVISNILSNAIKYTSEGGNIEFTIKQTKLNDAAEGVLFSVKDYGNNIPEGENEVIFEPFIQGSDTETGTNIGIGIGLSISKHIITLHHGKIWAENHPEGGAIFSFIIPVEQPEIIPPKRRKDDKS